ncbi:MAG: phage portal protein [Patescibacteria group bacterium]
MKVSAELKLWPFRFSAQVGEKRELSLESAKGWDIFTGSNTEAGVPITETSALRISAVMACVRVLSETIASLPLHVYQEDSAGSRTINKKHSLYPILHNSSNPRWTSFNFRETMQAWLCLWGNAYAEIRRDVRGRVIALYPLHPAAMKVFEDRYECRLQNGGLKIFPVEQILHVRGLAVGDDGLTGLSPIGYARETLGAARAGELFGARFFKNSARPSGVLQHPGQLGDHAVKMLKEGWSQALTDENQHKIAVLEEGMQWHPLTVPNDEAQWIESRKFSVSDIARIFRIPPHLIGDLERATFSNVEQQSIDFVMHTIRPWLVRWEQAIQLSLFTSADDRDAFAEFSIEGLLRGDMASRAAYVSAMVLNGIYTRNEIRKFDNNPPLEGGDLPLIPMAEQIAPITREELVAPTPEAQGGTTK